MTALVAILVGVVPQGCRDIQVEMIQVRVELSGLTTCDDAVEIFLVPGIYDFVATGVADAESADVALTVLDSLAAAEITTIQLRLTLAEASAAPDDTGSGERTGLPIVEGGQAVTIPFHWQGTTPTADVDVDMNFYDSPDILDWDTEPHPPVRPGTLLSVWVRATNNEGPQEKLTVESQFIDERDGSVINKGTLAFAGGDLFEGEIEAPAYSGAPGLRIVATDSANGVTQHERTYVVE